MKRGSDAPLVEWTRSSTLGLAPGQAARPRTALIKAALLNLIRESNAARGRGPTLREMCDALGLTSPSAASYYLDQLQREGRIKREKNRSGSIHLFGEE